MQGTRSAAGHSPLREGGGAAMNGVSVHGERRAAGAATGGVLRGGRRGKRDSAPSTGTHIKPFADGPCRRIHRRLPAVLPPPPAPFASEAQSKRLPSTGRHPPHGGGECLHTLLPPNAAPQAHHHHPVHHNPRRTQILLQNLFRGLFVLFPLKRPHVRSA